MEFIDISSDLSSPLLRAPLQPTPTQIIMPGAATHPPYAAPSAALVSPPLRPPRQSSNNYYAASPAVTHPSNNFAAPSAATPSSHYYAASSAATPSSNYYAASSAATPSSNYYAASSAATPSSNNHAASSTAPQPSNYYAASPAATQQRSNYYAASSDAMMRQHSPYDAASPAAMIVLPLQSIQHPLQPHYSPLPLNRQGGAAMPTLFLPWPLPPAHHINQFPPPIQHQQQGGNLGSFTPPRPCNPLQHRRQLHGQELPTPYPVPHTLRHPVQPPRSQDPSILPHIANSYPSLVQPSAGTGTSSPSTVSQTCNNPKHHPIIPAPQQPPSHHDIQLDSRTHNNSAPTKYNRRHSTYRNDSRSCSNVNTTTTSSPPKTPTTQVPAAAINSTPAVSGPGDNTASGCRATLSTAVASAISDTVQPSGRSNGINTFSTLSSTLASTVPSSCSRISHPPTSTTPTSLSSILSTVAARELQANPGCIFSPLPDSEDECCADSGATHVMLPDYKAFNSYRTQVGRTVTLGDKSTVPIAGEGTATFSINGKVITVRNALHVPDLRQPLYSLRKHKSMPGCGTFSHSDVGSLILFPNFILDIDDSIDNIITYKSIGRQQPIYLSDYIEPRPSSASTADASHSPTSSPDTSDIMSDSDLMATASEPLPLSLLSLLHPDPTSLPPIRPENTPAPCESRTLFDPLKLHKIFGCRRFKNQQHIIAASQNATLLKTGEFPVSLGSFTTIPNPPAGKTSKKRRKYLDKVHLDIVFGDCMSLGGYTHALLLVDSATRYSWIYGLASLTSASIIDALQQFHAHATRLPTVFHTDFDTKLIGGETLRWILSHQSNIIASPAYRHSSNGLVERTWRTLITMARAYITEKQVSRKFWFFAIAHASSMLNQVPGRLGRKLTSPFELVHGSKPDSKTWFELFSVGYFNHSSDGATSRSKCDAHTLDGIAVGRDDKSNSVVFYNPITRRYYRPPAFKLDETRLPITNFPKSLTYDGGLTCGLLRNRTDPTTEPYPPGMRVLILTTPDATPVKGTIQNVPLPSNESTLDSTTTYTVLLDDGTTQDVQFHQLQDPSEKPTSLPTDPTTYTNTRISGLPHDLQPNCKVTMDHNGAFHKGYLVHDAATGFSFEYRRHPRASKPEWTVPLPNFLLNWPTLMADDVLFPGHSTVSSFLRPTSNASEHASANFVSATNLQRPCPASLKIALDENNPDRFIWSELTTKRKGGWVTCAFTLKSPRLNTFAFAN